MITDVYYEFEAFPTTMRHPRRGWRFGQLSTLRFVKYSDAVAEVKRLKKIYVRENVKHRKDPDKPALLNRSEINGYGPTFLRIFKVTRQDTEST